MGKKYGDSMTANDNTQNTGKGLALPGLIVGLLTGLAVYGIVEFWLDGRDDDPLPFTVLLFVVTTAAAYLLLAETDRLIKALAGALAIAALLILPDYFMARAAGDDTLNLSNFPPIFWFIASRWIAAYILVTLVKASFEGSAPPAYRDVFFHGLTMPLIAGGAKLFALLTILLLFAWAWLLKEMDVEFFNKIFQEPWFFFPFLGAIGGLSIALIRGQQAVLGALRYIILLFCRIAIIIMALATVTFLFVLATKGTATIFDKPYPSAIMMGLALAGMLIFNGVYQNGEGGSPPLWLRLPTLITLIGFPVYTSLAFYAFWLRIGEYGLTPARIAGLSVNGLVALYSIVCLAGLVTELNWGGKRWMPLVGPLNTLMAVLWAITLAALATPLVNPWALSAESQYERIAKGKTAAADFDYGYLRFRLGEYGDKALDKMLALKDHPDAATIRDGVMRAKNAKTYWEYQHPEYETLQPEPGSGDSAPPENEPGVNPDDADADVAPDADTDVAPDADTDDPDTAQSSPQED